MVNVEQARIAEEAGAVAVMALERIPADIRKDGGVARMSDPKMIREIKEAVSIPVMAKVIYLSYPLAQISKCLFIFFAFGGGVRSLKAPEIAPRKTPMQAGNLGIAEALLDKCRQPKNRCYVPALEQKRVISRGALYVSMTKDMS